MRKQILRVSVVQTAKVMAAIYVVTSLPFVAIMALGFATQLPGVGAGMLVLFPLLYGVGAFLGSIIAAFIYNLVAARIGGIEFTTAEVGAISH